MSNKPKKKTPPAEPENPPAEIPYPGALPRPRDFPSIAEIAHIAAIFSNGQAPEGDEAAQSLAESALRIWRVAHDERAKQLADAEAYWQTMDRINAAKLAIPAIVKARLAKLGAPQLFDAQNVSWKDAAKLLWKGKKAESQLKAFVEKHIAGVIDFWKRFTADDFARLGFEHLAFITLIQLFDEEEAAREKAEESAKMKRVRAGEKTTPSKISKSAT